MSAPALALHQFRYDQKSFWRNPAAVFFTVAFPLMFLLIFELIFGDDTLEQLGNLKTDVYYVPAILTLAVVSATMQSVAIRLTTERENGILKRGRGTPMPPWVFFAGRIGNALVISLLMLIIVPGDRPPDLRGRDPVGPPAGGAGDAGDRGGELLLPSGSRSPRPSPPRRRHRRSPTSVIFPLYFLSGVLIPETEIPDGVLKIADIFPIRHFFEAFFAAWNPQTAGAGFEWGHLAVVAGWGVLGLVLAIRFFRWTPRGG